MEISDFSSLIEVGVTLNIACVAVEYVKSYTTVLCNQVFSLGSRIDTAVNDCRIKLDEVMDETTLKTLPDSLRSGNIVALKRQLTKRREDLTNDIENKKKEMEETVSKVCEVKSISSICLWLFLYGLAALFLMGVEEEDKQNTLIHIFWVILTTIGGLLIIIGWFSEGEKRPWWKFGYCSLRFSLLSFGVSVLLSSLCLLIRTSCFIEMIECFWNTFLVISLIAIYSNFVVSSFKVWNKAKDAKLHIEKVRSDLMSRCINWNDEAADLQGALHTDERLNAQEGSLTD